MGWLYSVACRGLTVHIVERDSKKIPSEAVGARVAMIVYITKNVCSMDYGVHILIPSSTTEYVVYEASLTSPENYPGLD